MTSSLAESRHCGVSLASDGRRTPSCTLCSSAWPPSFQPLQGRKKGITINIRLRIHIKVFLLYHIILIILRKIRKRDYRMKALLLIRSLFFLQIKMSVLSREYGSYLPPGRAMCMLLTLFCRNTDINVHSCRRIIASQHLQQPWLSYQDQPGDPMLHRVWHLPLQNGSVPDGGHLPGRNSTPERQLR